MAGSNMEMRSANLSKKKKGDESGQTLRETIIEDLSTKIADTKRDVPVTARLDNEIVDMLDILVKLGIFKSRSDAIASILENTLLDHRDRFKQLTTEISRLEKIQDRAKDIALEVLQGKST
jgi:Arc/MetJ-type ribon-helix-helix transcriptional regulator